MHRDVHLPDPRAEFFDTLAEGWEERNYPPETRERLSQLIPCFEVASGSTVLDIGTGTGVLTAYLREFLGPDGTLLSTDISFEMVRYAASKNMHSTGAVFQATCMSLPVQDASIDTVICFAAFPHFSDKATSLNEMYRVLRKGGSLHVAHLLSREELSRHHGKHPAVADDRLPDDAEMQSLFAGAGFSGLNIIDIPGRYLASAVKR